MKPNGIQSECTALYNLLAYELGAVGPEIPPQGDSQKNGSVRKDPPAGADAAPAHTGMDDARGGCDPLATPVAVVDLGHEGSRLLVCSSSELWVRNLGFGGQLLTRALVQELKVTTAAAEKYKRDPLAAPSVSQIYRAASPVLEDLLRELQTALVPSPTVIPNSVRLSKRFSSWAGRCCSTASCRFSKRANSSWEMANGTIDRLAWGEAEAVQSGFNPCQSFLGAENAPSPACAGGHVACHGDAAYDAMAVAVVVDRVVLRRAVRRSSRQYS